MIKIPIYDQPYEQNLQQQLYDTYRSKGKHRQKLFSQDRNAAAYTGFYQPQPADLIINDQSTLSKYPNAESEPDFARVNFQSHGGTSYANRDKYNEDLKSIRSGRK